MFKCRHIKSGEINNKSVHLGYIGLNKFLKKLISKQYGVWALDHLSENLTDLFALMKENLVIYQELIIDYTSFLLDDEKAHTQFEIHILLRKELPSQVSLRKHVSFWV